MVTKRYLTEKWITPMLEKRREERKKLYKEAVNEGRQEGRQEGQQEERQAWLAWNRRREEAVTQGMPFDEPPPSS